MELTTRRRRTIAAVLAVALAVETVSAVAAVATTGRVTHDLPADPPVGQVLAAESVAERAADRRSGSTSLGDPVRSSARSFTPYVVDGPVPHGLRAASAHIARPDPTPKPKAAPKSKADPKPKAKAPTPKPKAASYTGKNRVWIPSLGVSRSTRWFPCDRSRPPDNYMYRWGCAGANNVYLMGHAYGVMKPLHDAYVSGRLRKGMKAWYADGSGKIHQYVVKWWKVVRPTTSASWAWAAQDTPSMTLQTCVGKNSAYRLMVRLVRSGG